MMNEPQRFVTKCTTCDIKIQEYVLTPGKSFEPDKKVGKLIKKHVQRGHRIEGWVYVGDKEVSHTWIDYGKGIGKKTHSDEL